jgi:hypothetical protein
LRTENCPPWPLYLVSSRRFRQGNCPRCPHWGTGTRKHSASSGNDELRVRGFAKTVDNRDLVGGLGARFPRLLAEPAQNGVRRFEMICRGELPQHRDVPEGLREVCCPCTQPLGRGTWNSA